MYIQFIVCGFCVNGNEFIYSWYLLGEVLHALPDKLAILAIKDPETNDVLRHAAKPKRLDYLCDRLMKGSCVCWDYVSFFSSSHTIMYLCAYSSQLLQL